MLPQFQYIPAVERLAISLSLPHPARIWRDPHTGRASARFWRSGGYQRCTPHDGRWRWSHCDDDGNATNGKGDSLRLDKVELWLDHSVRWHAYNHVYKAIGGINNYYNEIAAATTEVGPGEKDAGTVADMMMHETGSFDADYVDGMREVFDWLTASRADGHSYVGRGDDPRRGARRVAGAALVTRDRCERPLEVVFQRLPSARS